MVNVSIIVPVYNTEKYLKKCLDSLVNQTLSNIEILVVNDGSNDNSQKIINEYAEKYSFVRSLIKANGGLSDARNYAIPYATGEYIGFVDSDDYVEPDMYQKMYSKAKQKNLDLIECNFIWEYDDKIKYDIGNKYTNTDDFFLLGRVMVCNKLFKLSLVKDNNIKFPVGLRYEDIEFFYKLVPYFDKTDLLDNNFYHYMQRENSIINEQNEKTGDIFIILNNLITFYKNNNLYEKYKENIEYLYIRILMGSSFLRMVKITDNDCRKNLLNKSYIELNKKFPNWKKNRLLKVKNIKNIYYKTINKFSFKIYSFLFKFV